MEYCKVCESNNRYGKVVCKEHAPFTITTTCDEKGRWHHHKSVFIYTYACNVCGNTWQASHQPKCWCGWPDAPVERDKSIVVKDDSPAIKCSKPKKQNDFQKCFQTILKQTKTDSKNKDEIMGA